ncbi:MAG: peptidase inhibitor family I36 protein [Micrococcales bacterium]|uniref:peptidase inhibitor family I36 protein n=1 Tax=Phycicoccus sp. TaxID=1902410 RepID=UPI0019A55D89|nr:peptidase inhibitor family I36 protein [Phycicoccus sp.]MBD3781801.1 peptidase inhibitor family I36 protein [Micrococcales bacterium]HMM96618.1 peptidase inhibitor family I36 protein [Phycicoccus sp.]
MRHTALAAASAAAAAAALVVSVAPTASAATGYARCPANRMCVFTGPNGTGAIGIFRNGDVNLADGVGPVGLNNNIESMRNRTSGYWCFYKDTNYNGYVWRGGPGGGANTIPAATNVISSLKRC